MVLSCLDLPCLTLPCLALSCLVWCRLMWSYVVLRSHISNRLASSCLFLSWLVLSRLSFVFHDERNNCELAERKRNHNTEQHRRNSNSIKHIYKKSSFWGPILNNFWGLKGSSIHSKPHFLQILCPNGDPIGDPGITLGATKWPRKPPKVCFWGVFFSTCFFH